MADRPNDQNFPPTVVDGDLVSLGPRLFEWRHTGLSWFPTGAMGDEIAAMYGPGGVGDALHEFIHETMPEGGYF